MISNVTKCLFGLTLWVVLLGEPPINSSAQRIDFKNVPLVDNKKTQQDVNTQEAVKQSLFQQAFKNQDTVTLLISKRSRPRLVRTIKRVPVFIPILPPKEPYTLKENNARTVDTKIPNYKTSLQTAAVFPINNDSTTAHTTIIKKHRGFLYRLFHKKY